jgi:hypothetical protein
MSAVETAAGESARSTKSSFLLQRVQPAMTGLIDGSLSTLAPIFAVALATHRPQYAFFAGLATAIGAGAITGSGTFLGGILHTLPFLTTAPSSVG